MKLNIDGREVIAGADQSLLDIVKEMGLVTGKLSTDPIAAKIAGDIFTLNYIPLREKDVRDDLERTREAVAASGGNIRLVRYSDPAGYEVYTRTAQFVLFLAIKQLWPDSEAKMSFTVGSGLYVKVTGAPDFSAELLRERVDQIVADDLPLLRHRITTKEAILHYESKNEPDKARLLSYRSTPTFDIYSHGDFYDYYYGDFILI